MNFFKRVQKLLYYSALTCFIGVIPFGLSIWVVLDYKEALVKFLNLKPQLIIDIAIIILVFIVIAFAGILLEYDYENKTTLAILKLLS